MKHTGNTLEEFQCPNEPVQSIVEGRGAAIFILIFDGVS